MYGCCYRKDDTLNITILTKAACPKCLAAKSKLAMMGLGYAEERVTLEKLQDLNLTDTDIPAFVIEGKGYTYPAAMALLKEHREAEPTGT